LTGCEYNQRAHEKTEVQREPFLFAFLLKLLEKL